jgi:hypothetical protein
VAGWNDEPKAEAKPDDRRWRSAITGRFVSALYALRHPRQTIGERRKKA